MDLVRTTYKKDDCIILLKDLTGVMKPLSTEEREKCNQSGVHYSEMLPEEKEPSAAYKDIYDKAVERTKSDMTKWVAQLGEIIMAKTENRKPVLLSLARAGIPLGVLIKRYIKVVHSVDCSHYAISIIRDKGIDINAMKYVYDAEVKNGQCRVEDFIFIDGWVGKGVINQQVCDAVKELKSINSKWKTLKDDLYVVTDSANVTKYCATRRDCMLPFACLNSTVSGLISRTILNNHIDTGSGDFHGAVYFKQFESIDQTNKYIDTISADDMKKASSMVDKSNIQGLPFGELTGMEVVNKICKEFNISDYKKVKPGIGETTRVLLRRVPYMVLINSNVENNDEDIQHILELCKQKNVRTERYDLGDYKVCGVVKDFNADA